MATAVFIDTSILLYAASDGVLEPEKTRLSRMLLRSQCWTVSVQVIQEFHANAVRKVALSVSSRHAAELIDALLERCAVSTTPELYLGAVVLQNRYSLCYWDAAIIQAAQTAGCAILYSEDMGHGAVYGEVMVVNPFVDEGRWVQEVPTAFRAAQG